MCGNLNSKKINNNKIKINKYAIELKYGKINEAKFKILFAVSFYYFNFFRGKIPQIFHTNKSFEILIQK